MERALHDIARQRLLARRDKILSILRNLEIQRTELRKRESLHDDATEPIRTTMLDSLDSWYHKELTDIDNALARVRESHFGICIGCNHEIDLIRLQKCPEAEFCTTCEELKKWMQIS
jgi:DnaK suppressor protein